MDFYFPLFILSFFGSGYAHYFGNTETEQHLMRWPGYQYICRKASTSLTRSGSSLLLLNHVARRSVEKHHHWTAGFNMDIIVVSSIIQRTNLSFKFKLTWFSCCKKLKHDILQSSRNLSSTFTMVFSLLDMLTGRKWIFGIFSWMDDMSGNLQRSQYKKLFMSTSVSIMSLNVIKKRRTCWVQPLPFEKESFEQMHCIRLP
jgi:hypothetical protein